MTRILLALLAFYSRWLSPVLHSLGTGGCRYLPTCSEYARQAIATYGPLRGTGLALWRLLRCHPFRRGGFDPVPTTSRDKDRALGTPVSGTGIAQQRPFPHEPLP